MGNRILRLSLWILGLALLSLASLYAIGLYLGVPARQCRTATLSTARSPDQLWSAEVRESICDGVISLFIGDQVFLVPSGVAAPAGVAVYKVDIGGNQDARPELRWSGPHVLSITGLSAPYAKVLRHEYRGITILLKPPRTGP